MRRPIGTAAATAAGISSLTLLSANVARADRVDDYIRGQMAERHIPGVSIAIVRDGKVVKTAGYGLADVELGVPATTHTVYPLASVTKQFTVAAIMLLVQDGKVALDDPVGKYLPDVPASWSAVTLRRLLTHSSGIPNDNPMIQSSAAGWPEGTAPEHVLAWAARQPLDFPPGTKWGYSNTNYTLLALVVERVSGMPYDRFLNDRMFGALGMSATRTDSLADVIPDLAGGYAYHDGELHHSATFDPSLHVGAGSLASDVLDLARWAAALDGDAPLTPAARKQMWTASPAGDSTTEGLGWNVDSFLGNPRVWIDGSGPGASTLFARFPDRRLSVIVLCNATEAGAYGIGMHVAGLVDGALAHPPGPLPRFTMSASAPSATVPQRTPITLAFTVTDSDIPASDIVLQAYVRDSAGRRETIYSVADKDFTAGQSRTFTLTWTPPAAGSYRLGVGAYAARKDYTYAEQDDAATVTTN